MNVVLGNVISVGRFYFASLRVTRNYTKWILYNETCLDNKMKFDYELWLTRMLNAMRKVCAILKTIFQKMPTTVLHKFNIASLEGLRESNYIFKSMIMWLKYNWRCHMYKYLMIQWMNRGDVWRIRVVGDIAGADAAFRSQTWGYAIFCCRILRRKYEEAFKQFVVAEPHT